MNGNSRVALVTGSSRGIGRAIALELAARGYRVVVNYASSAESAEAVRAEIERLGGEALVVGANVAIAADRERLVEAPFSRWGRLDLLVNNAGITSPGRKDVLEATPESWDAVFDTNLKGPFFLAQLAARRMIEQPPSAMGLRGAILFISSISAIAVSTNRGDYCIAKSAMEMMTWLFAERLAADEIVVHEICPGVIESDMTAPVKAKYDALLAGGLAPLRRWGKPEDVAKVVGMIAEGGLPYSTGQRIFVDGGFHLRRL